MGRRKIGQPRVHRIVVMDQFSNEIESHELDEYGRLKEKIVPTKRPRNISLLANNPNINAQNQLNKFEMQKDKPSVTIQYPQSALNMPKVINNQSEPEQNIYLNNNNNTDVTSIANSNDKFENDENAPYERLPISLPSANNEIQNSLIKLNQGSFKENYNNDLYNIPQPKVKPILSDEGSIIFPKNPIQSLQRPQNEETDRIFDNLSEQQINKSIPIPMVISPSLNNRVQPSSNNVYQLSMNDDQYSNQYGAENVYSRYLAIHTIYDNIEDPSVPAFITPDE